MPKRKKQTNKGKTYQKMPSLYGVSETDALKDLLKSPPMPKPQKRKSTRKK